MIKKLTLQRFLELARSKARVAVYKEFVGDRITPVSVYHALSQDYHGLSLLESCGNGSGGRYSYLCLEPYSEFVEHNGDTNKPLQRLQDYLSNCNCHYEHPLCRYAGAAVGFIGYDAVRFIEDIPDSNRDELNLPDLFFRSYRVCIAFDHENGKTFVTIAVDVGDNPEQAYRAAMETIDNLIYKTSSYNQNQFDVSSQMPIDEVIDASTDINDEQYSQIANKAKQYIVDGDAFQIVLSRTFKKKYTADPFDIYRALRITNPSPYMFYIEHKDFTIVGASPEKLVSVKDNIVETNPIAGTRPRGESEMSDSELEQELLQDQKEIAEHMMLVDLGRNDLGAICLPGSVKVKKLKGIQKLSRVMHITSLVEGNLAPAKKLIDVIKAVFPAGTLSGAPKIRAMEIIDELEITRRGIYGGAICIIDGARNLDACIAIRMAVLKDNVAYVRAGAGIVYDSIPEKEAEETRHKAAAVIEAITLAEGGLL